MIEILIGLPVLLLLLCLIWNALYFLENDNFIEPPKIIKVIGFIEFIIMIIIFVLSLAYAMGKVILGG